MSRILFSMIGKAFNPNCPPGEHIHPPFNYCHPIERKHRGISSTDENKGMPNDTADDLPFYQMPDFKKQYPKPIDKINHLIAENFLSIEEVIESVSDSISDVYESRASTDTDDENDDPILKLATKLLKYREYEDMTGAEKKEEIESTIEMIREGIEDPADIIIESYEDRYDRKGFEKYDEEKLLSWMVKALGDKESEDLFYNKLAPSIDDEPKADEINDSGYIKRGNNVGGTYDMMTTMYGIPDDISDSDFAESKFEDITMEGKNASESDFTSCSFERAKISQNNFKASVFRNAVMKNTKAMGSNFTDCDMRGTDAEYCDFTGANFTNADLRNVFFSDCKMDGANFKGARIFDTHKEGWIEEHPEMEEASWERDEEYHKREELERRRRELIEGWTDDDYHEVTQEMMWHDVSFKDIIRFKDQASTVEEIARLKESTKKSDDVSKAFNPNCPPSKDGRPQHSHPGRYDCHPVDTKHRKGSVGDKVHQKKGLPSQSEEPDRPEPKPEPDAERVVGEDFFKECPPGEDGTPRHKHPGRPNCHPITQRHQGEGKHPIPGDSDYVDLATINAKASRISEVPPSPEDNIPSKPNTERAKHYASRLNQKVRDKVPTMDSMTASRMDKAMGSMMSDSMPNIKNFIPTVEELIGDDKPDSFFPWEQRNSERIPHAKNMISQFKKYLKERKEYLEIIENETYVPTFDVDGKPRFNSPDIDPYSMLREMGQEVGYSSKGFNDEVMPLVDLTYLYAMNQMLTNTPRDHALIGMVNLVDSTLSAFEDAMIGMSDERKHYYTIVYGVRERLEPIIRASRKKATEGDVYDEQEIQDTLNKMMSVLDDGLKDDGEAIHPIIEGFTEQTRTFAEMLINDTDGEVIGQGPINVAIGNKKPTCPQGEHIHPPFDYCHPIKRRHRELNGSTGDPMMDAKIVDDYDFIREKEGILSDDKSQEEQRLHQERYAESLKRMESLRDELRPSIQYLVDNIPQTNEDNRRLSRLLKYRMDDMDNVIEGVQKIKDGTTTDNTIYKTLESVESLKKADVFFQSLFGADLPDNAKDGLFSTVFSIEDRTTEMYDVAEQLVLNSILSSQSTEGWRSDAKRDAKEFSKDLEGVFGGLKEDSDYEELTHHIYKIAGALKVTDRLETDEDTFADFKIIMDRVISSRISIGTDTEIAVPSSILAYLFTHSGNKDAYKQKTTIGETKGLNRTYDYSPIQSHKDAKKIISKHGITVSPKSLPLEIVPPNILDNVINGLVEMKDITGGFAPPIAFTQDSRESLGGFFSNATLEVSIPINTDSWDVDDIQSNQFESRYSTGHSTSYHPHHIIRHELGHALHVYNRIGEQKYKAVMEDMKSIRPSKENDEYMRVRAKHGVYLPRTEEAIYDSDSTTYDKLFIRQKYKNLLKPEVLKDIYRYVSDYGATNINELVAEMYSGMLDGKKYPDSLKKIYRAVKGYWPEGEEMP